MYKEFLQINKKYITTLYTKTYEIMDNQQKQEIMNKHVKKMFNLISNKVHMKARLCFLPINLQRLF